MNLFCVGISHHTADVETRERFAGHAAIDQVLREEAGCSEALLVTTCNRVEVYAVSDQVIPTERVVHCLSGSGMEPLEKEIGAFYRHEAGVVCSISFGLLPVLDSMVIGETEILGQVKKAYEAARGSGAAGPFLHRLFQRAFRVAKQVRTHTWNHARLGFSRLGRSSIWRKRFSVTSRRARCCCSARAKRASGPPARC
jgi:glutamyl-tRNA reductase